MLAAHQIQNNSNGWPCRSRSSIGSIPCNSIAQTRSVSGCCCLALISFSSRGIPAPLKQVLSSLQLERSSAITRQCTGKLLWMKQLRQAAQTINQTLARMLHNVDIERVDLAHFQSFNALPV